MSYQQNAFSFAQDSYQEHNGAQALINASSRISEMSIPGSAQMKHLLPTMLCELAEQETERWLCWVSTTPIQAVMQNRHAKKQVLQIVNAQKDELVKLAERALANGKSHTVVLAVESELSSRDVARIEIAAEFGNAECLLLKAK